MTLQPKGEHESKVKSKKITKHEDFVQEIQKIIDEHPRLYEALAEDKFDY